MGYFTRGGWPGGETKHFTPDNDEKTLWIAAQWLSLSLKEIIDLCKDHFGEDISLDALEITPEYIHTDCLGYDQYDPTDYTNYLKITKT